MENSTIGIIGVGMVGGALKHYFESVQKKPLLYDPSKGFGSQLQVNGADVLFICVPTPFRKDHGFDLSVVESTFQWLGGGKIVVIKSTVLPGTTEKFQSKYPQHKILFNPEFLVERRAIEDMMHPDRQIVGYTKESKDVAEKVLELLPRAPFEKLVPASEAEMIKYFGNTYLATKVIFANQMYDLCKQLGVDYEIVKEGASSDPRIGQSHLDVFHGGYRGYGGKCLPKDIRALIQFADEHQVDLKLHKLVEELNNELMRIQSIEDPEKFSQRE
ncbi:MAG: hypothetical protein AAB567_01810 [Patescibacteria group bacterium]